MAARERGFVLVAALVLAVLYFMLMELMMIDASRSLAEAQRFKARTMAAVLADNAVELAASQLVIRTSAMASAEDFQGEMEGRMSRVHNSFEIEGESRVAGAVKANATVFIEGTIEGNKVYIDFSRQSQ